METPERREYYRAESDSSLNPSRKKNNNPNIYKHNRNISKSSNTLDGSGKYSKGSSNRILSHENSNSSLNSCSSRNGNYRSERRDHSLSKSKSSDMRRNVRGKNGSVDELNHISHSKSRSDGHIVDNNGNKRPEKVNDDKTRGRMKNEDGSRDRNRDRNRDYDRDRNRDRNRGRDRSRDANIDRDRSRGRDRSRDVNIDRDRSRGRDRDRDRDIDRDRIRNRDRDRDRSRDGAVDRDRNRGRDRERERVIDRDRNRDGERGNDINKYNNREREGDGDKNKESEINESVERERNVNGIKYPEKSRAYNYSNENKIGEVNELNDINNANDNNIPNNNQLNRYPSSSAAVYKQRYQVNISSPLSKPADPTQQRKPSSSSLKRNSVPPANSVSPANIIITVQPPPVKRPPPPPLSKLRSVPSNLSSVSNSNNQYPIPPRPHLLKEESSTSFFSEVSISSTANNHFKFTENINNNYIEGKDKNINNKITNNELEDFNDESSDESNECDNNANDKDNNNKNCQRKSNIPLVERNGPQAVQEEKDEDVERDRYGFKISYQYISRESQLLFQKNYQVILERRKSRWKSLLKENGGHIPNKISKKVKRFIHKGIPQDLRPECWFKYSGAEKMSQKWPNLYRTLLNCEIEDKKKGKFLNPCKMAKSIEEIEKDLYRTFPDNEKFYSDSQEQSNIEKKNPNAIREIKNPYIKALRNILVAFSYYSIDPSQGGAASEKHSKYTIGYCQSLNYIAGLLLIIFADGQGVKFPEQSFEVEEKCFWMMIALVDEILPAELYEERQMQGAQIEQDVLWDNLVGENGKKFGLSSVAEWVAYMERGEIIHNKSKYAHWNSGASMPALKSITLPWMLTCFVNVLPIETVLRVWDCLFAEGSKILIRVILTLFRIFKDDITSINDGMVAWTFIKDMPHRIINCHEFMEICFRPVIYISPTLHTIDFGEGQIIHKVISHNTISNMDDDDNADHIRSYSSPDSTSVDEKKLSKKVLFSHKANKSNSGRINELATGSTFNLTRSKSDSYRMNYKKRGVGNISQKSIDKFRKIQWDKEQKKNINK